MELTKVNGAGMRKANDLGITLPKTVIFGEPTELKLALSQKVYIRVTFNGRVL
jgi:hypothetical protein